MKIISMSSVNKQLTVTSRKYLDFPIVIINCSGVNFGPTFERLSIRLFLLSHFQLWRENQASLDRFEFSIS